jgi:hypothetical protein
LTSYCGVEPPNAHVAGQPGVGAVPLDGTVSLKVLGCFTKLSQSPTLGRSFDQSAPEAYTTNLQGYPRHTGDTGDKPPLSHQVLFTYIVVPCPMLS